MVQHPKYVGPSKIIKPWTRDQFYEIIGTEDPQVFKPNLKAVKSKDLGKIDTTLVFFTASWSEECLYTYSMWAKISNKYTTKKIRMVEVDCSKFDVVCK